jgi:hypothetical protein
MIKMCHPNGKDRKQPSNQVFKFMEKTNKQEERQDRWTYSIIRVEFEESSLIKSWIGVGLGPGIRRARLAQGRNAGKCHSPDQVQLSEFMVHSLPCRIGFAPIILAPRVLTFV